MSMEDFTDSSDEVSESKSNEDVQQSPSQKESVGGNATTVINDKQKRELERLAKSLDVEPSIIIDEFKEDVSDPIYQSIEDSDQRFRLVKASIESKYEDRNEIVSVDMIVLGSFTRYIPGEWNAALSTVVGKGKLDGKLKVFDVNAFEEDSGKIYKIVEEAEPFSKYSVNLALEEWKDKKTNQKVKIYKLDERTRFRNGVSPREANMEKFGNMDEVALLKKFFGLDVYKDINEAGLSLLDKKGRPLKSDIKAVKVIIQEPSKEFEARGDAFDDLWTWKSKATDLANLKAGISTPNKLDINFPPFKKYKRLIPAGKKRAMGIAVGPLGEYNDKPYIDAFNWIHLS